MANRDVSADWRSLLATYGNGMILKKGCVIAVYDGPDEDVAPAAGIFFKW